MRSSLQQLATGAEERLAASAGRAGHCPAGGPWLSELPDRLHVEAWRDPLIDEIGHDPRSAYVENYWLPVLGPSTIWLLRRFAAHLDESPAGADFETADLARRLGIGERAGMSSPFARTLRRCVDFQMARWQGGGLEVRRRLPPLASRHVRRLPDSLQEEHRFESAARGRPTTLTDRLRLHGRRLALSLLEFGEDRAATEAQLVRWGFHPSLACECAAAALLEQARRRAARRPPG